MTSAVTRLGDAAALLDALDLDSVHFIELHGERVPERDADTGLIEMGVAHSETAEAITVSFRCILRHEIADIIAAVQCRYAYREQASDDPVPPEVLREFIERVAVMAAYPFLRQGVHTLSAMLGLPALTLGLLHAGAFVMGDDPEPTPSTS